MNDWEKAIREWEFILPRKLLEGRVGKQDELVFELHSKEQGHNRPHIHVHTSIGDISIAIDKIEVLHKNERIQQKTIDKALAWVEKNLDMLREKWNEIPNVVKFDLY